MPVIVTNNPKVCEYMHRKRFASEYELRWVDGYTEQVLRAVRDLCHQGYSLITHPLTGSIKPNQTPYKTVVLENSDHAIDFTSVRMAEDSLHKAESLLQSRPRSPRTGEFLDDFAVIDLDFFKSYLFSINYITE